MPSDHDDLKSTVVARPSNPRAAKGMILGERSTHATEHVGDRLRRRDRCMHSAEGSVDDGETNVSRFGSSKSRNADAELSDGAESAFDGHAGSMKEVARNRGRKKTQRGC